jgi:replicative DNA helicase
MSQQQQNLKLPLQDTGAEEKILGKILVNPEAITKVAHILKPESFYLESHQEIYRAAYSLYGLGRPVYLTTVLTWLKSYKTLAEVGGEDKLNALADLGSCIGGIADEAAAVADRYVRRQLTTAANEIAELAHETKTPLEEVVNQSQERVYKINAETVKTNDSRSKSQAEAVIKTKEYIEADNKIFNLGFYDLDYLLGGLEPGTLTILAGRPSMGKSQGALAICHQIAHLHQMPVAYFSLEMSLVQLECRLWSLISGHSAYKDKKFSTLKSDRIRRHRARIQPLLDWEREMLWEIAEVATTLPIFINENRSISLQGVWSETRDLIRNHGQLGCVVVDYLQMMAGVGEDDNRSYELGKIARGLYNMAGELGVPVVAVSQVNRAVEGRTNKRPMMSDLAQSGILEMVADTIIAMYRDEYYNADSPDRGIIEWLALKARLGETGVAKMIFDPSCGIFRNLQRNDD